MTNFTKEQLEIIYEGVFDSNEELGRLRDVLCAGADPSYINCTIERLEVLIRILQQYNSINRNED
tara:strand:+ start:89 stop:283 length:195 start_codon:yes stop_codon:yes gene_type:complete